jgi:hypothetical protein
MSVFLLTDLFTNALALALAALLLANREAGDMKLVPRFLIPGKVALRLARPPFPEMRPGPNIVT